MQDWELACADAGRLEDFLNAYERRDLVEDDRFALMALIVSSFDDWLADGGTDDAMVARIRQHLVAEFNLHRWTIRYWSLLDGEDAADAFHATPFMRELWNRNG